jgi:hypothetical protein
MSYIILTQDFAIDKNLDEKDREFLESQSLIYKKNLFYSNFVGEVITPHNKYFSLPKNITDESLIDLIKLLLAKYNKDFRLKSLISNKKFILTKDKEFKATKYYFSRLASFFLDFVTYEFIYPYETKKVHSIDPLPGTIDMISTNINRKIYGDGATYDVVDRKNSEDWKLDDIYYSTVISLAEEIGDLSKIKEVERMKDYLNEEGHDVKRIDISNNEEMIKEIKKCNVNIIHYPIKNTLLEYFGDLSHMKESNYEINVFYTKNFEIVWEKIIREVLSHDEDFEKRLSDNFKEVEIKTKWFSSEEIPSKMRELKNKGVKISQDNPNKLEWKERDLRPDIFSEFSSGGKKLRFIGDAKYYNKIDSDYSKEQNEYNNAVDNKYPMCIFVAGQRTTAISSTISNRQLIIFEVSIKEVINDYLNSETNTLRKAHRLIGKYLNIRNKENGFL